MRLSHDMGVPMPSLDTDDAGRDIAPRALVDVWPPGSDERVLALRLKRADLVRIGPFEAVTPLDGGVVVRGPWGVETTCRTRAEAVQIIRGWVDGLYAHTNASGATCAYGVGAS